jgi:tetrahydromethanopterin S-methyltransferase subunit G
MGKRDEMPVSTQDARNFKELLLVLDEINEKLGLLLADINKTNDKAISKSTTTQKKKEVK